MAGLIFCQQKPSSAAQQAESGRNCFLLAETVFLSAEMIILKMEAIEHGAATGSAIEVLNL